MITVKIVSGLEKVFADGSINDYTEIKKISALKGERISFQIIAYRPHGDEIWRPILFDINLNGPLAKYATVRQVKGIPVTKPVHFEFDSDYLKTTPGLFPDVLIPTSYGGGLVVTPGTLHTLYVDVDIPKDCDAV